MDSGMFDGIEKVIYGALILAALVGFGLGALVVWLW